MKKKILIIDDEPDLLKLTKFALEAQGYEVKTAISAEDAFKAIEKERPDLLLLDLKLPGKSGFWFEKELKSNGKLKDIPIIVLSAMTDEASKYIAAKEGATAFMEKPVDIPKLKFYIKEILNK
jgi:DNA-binding response OmpR family regulator